ncbi:NAD(P)-dependent dehydrogenase (short-subunit alcohol dehydrogenase family) [Kibdelosporangium banguiense]|uniref:NAD(P)-dependent dehydrogenase (Short-subunit alcohol dehydrogenase family) n=1 Tax=Kibdelosporangium banguiense TaxID=1365924 RepID=A0ABS4TRN7_9PSEU|nr:SDR family NAD(P)-dependent oxidoreductase [Kibdelosporangium banguiense]MBP2327067.1 NAD(P)-dependent dehydrogenase (short-subunit alcohol dehydrogenase family) [Kibdelosporangium banguiense]
MRDEMITEGELAAFHETVARLRALAADDPVRLKAERVAESFAREGRLRRKKVRAAERVQADAVIDATTATGALDRREDAPLRPAPDASVRSLSRSRRCYVCKEPYQLADVFYHRLCPSCARENAERRNASTDLTGRRALLTGGRVKIGFQLALMLLRDGAELLVTTRFPRDAQRRFDQVPGSVHWADRLSVVGIDLRDPRQVLGLAESLREDGRPLDILVNNAAQTVRRPPESYAALIGGETGALPSNALLAPGFSPMLASGQNALALAGIDEAGLLLDSAPVNSWSARIGELDAAEVLETQLVNALAPTLLCDRLLPLLLASPHPRRYVVNVTAVEGRFAVRNKTSGHPHTNMAKAALNMLTRTSGPELAEQGVYMCSVDTGWITDENPAPKKARLAGNGFRTPLDIVDGAARVYDPIVRGEAGAPIAGVFLKDYREAAW